MLFVNVLKGASDPLVHATHCDRSVWMDGWGSGCHY